MTTASQVKPKTNGRRLIILIVIAAAVGIANLVADKPKSYDQPLPVAKAEPVNIEQDCLDLLLQKYKFKDPYSVRVEGSKTKWVGYKNTVRNVLKMDINAKNSFGAYAGSKTFSCVLSGDGKRVKSAL